MKPSDIRAMCCRLQLDLRELRRNVTGGLFGSSDATGSVGVVTLNMPRLGYLSKDEDEFFERLEWLMHLAKEALEIKRKLVERNIQGGLLPYTKRYLSTLRNHFSTVGLIGMHEALLNMGFDRGIVDKDGRRFAIKVLKFMREKLCEFQKETGNLYNLEATPAEGTSYRLAKIDKRKYPEIITAGEREPFYTNSTCLPVNHDLSLKEALQHQEELQCLYSGGTVFHVYLSGAFERLPDLRVPIMVGDLVSSTKGCSDLVRKIASGFRIPYFTLTPTFSLCESHGYIPGEHFRCPICEKECEVYSRVVGYYRPVGRWNAGKQEEFRLRSKFDSSIL
jgi:ribonucleoside-triphosphate reductase